MFIVHRFRVINTYLPKHKTSRDLNPPGGQFVVTRIILLGPTRAQNLTILSSAIAEKFKGCTILK